jgi:hypothetical protein
VRLEGFGKFKKTPHQLLIPYFTRDDMGTKSLLSFDTIRTPPQKKKYGDIQRA